MMRNHRARDLKSQEERAHLRAWLSGYPSRREQIPQETPMGPFPHDAPRATITPENPAGTDGFEFVEFAHPDPQVLRDLFARMGYTHTATHKTKAVELWQQGDITYVLNAEPGQLRRAFRGGTRSLRPVHGLARGGCAACVRTCGVERGGALRGR
jgi:hypothetical protein